MYAIYDSWFNESIYSKPRRKNNESLKNTSTFSGPPQPLNNFHTLTNMYST